MFKSFWYIVSEPLEVDPVVIPTGGHAAGCKDEMALLAELGISQRFSANCHPPFCAICRLNVGLNQYAVQNVWLSTDHHDGYVICLNPILQSFPKASLA